jgi:hypothetical protein
VAGDHEAHEYEQRPGLAALFARQARAAHDNGSPLYADLCRSASLDAAASGRVAELLAPWADSRWGDMVPLRVLGAAHRLVLERRAPELALWFPSVGGTAPPDAAGRGACWNAWVETLSSHRDELPTLLARPPQTNDPGRAGVLLGALHLVAHRWGMPIRLHELGTSAGLLLRADQVLVTWSGGSTGRQGSPVVLEDAWLGDPLPPTADVDVVERVGVDLDPVDITTTDGRLHLTSFVWPDQLHRLELLRGGLQLAEQIPADVRAGDLVEHLRSLHPRPGTVLVLWHSSVFLYLDDEQRREANREIERLGAESSPAAPVVEAAREYLGEQLGTSFPLVLRSWPTADPEIAADGVGVCYSDSPPHGLPVTWSGPRRVDPW